jgi:hypothetical protein
MGNKNKAGREVRKPKKDKKPKAVTPTSVIIPSAIHSPKDEPAK